MNDNQMKFILDITKAQKIEKIETIQNLWSNYGRLELITFNPDSPLTSAILKRIKIPDSLEGHKGLKSKISQERKIKSYIVEQNWYQNYNDKNALNENCRTANLIGYKEFTGEAFLLLENLNDIGFNKHQGKLSYSQIKVCVKWLAHFHSLHLQKTCDNLWPIGSYWHLETRQEELQRMPEGDLKTFAAIIDQQLQATNYKTIIHGDAKLENFLFNENSSQVAAVDFQYVGHGSGMRDLIYFMSSCMQDIDIFNYEEEILNLYFSTLKSSIVSSSIDLNDLEQKWRSLYPLAWTDFIRFLQGWKPSHWKLEKIPLKYSSESLSEIKNEFKEVVLSALNDSQIYLDTILNSPSLFKELKIEEKNETKTLVSEVDYKLQEIIIGHLNPLIHKYDLGVLSEEMIDDQSRFNKNYFFAIDPLDGTGYFLQQKPGFAVSVGLVSQQGEAVLGGVLNPVTRETYFAIKNNGCLKNNLPFSAKLSFQHKISTKLFADKSMLKHHLYPKLKKEIEITCQGSAVCNSLLSLDCVNGTYFKFPKKELGGCALWDLAAITVIIKELGGWISDYTGKPLNLNQKSSIYFNKSGLMICQNIEHFNYLKNLIQEISD